MTSLEEWRAKCTEHGLPVIDLLVFFPPTPFSPPVSNVRSFCVPPLDGRELITFDLKKLAEIELETKENIEAIWGDITLTGYPYTFPEYQKDNGKRLISNLTADGKETAIAERRRDLERLENKWSSCQRLSETELEDLVNLGKLICENGIIINDKDFAQDSKKDFVERWEVLALDVKKAHHAGSMVHLDAYSTLWELLKAYYLKVNDIERRRRDGSSGL